MTNNPLAKLSVQQLKRAVAIRERIDSLEQELVRITGGQSSTGMKKAGARKGRLSAAARARMSAAMKARWAKFRAQLARK